MILIAELEKPYTTKDRADFIIVYNNQQGCEIRETETVLQAWGYTEEEQAQKDHEIISQFSLTKREVFLALYQDKGVTPEQIKAQIQSPEALIEFEYATDYYRGNPLVEAIGQALGYTSDELDYLFLNKRLPEREGE